MAISPNQQERKAEEVRRQYEQAEIVLLNGIARRLMYSDADDLAEWQSEKLGQLEGLIREAENVKSTLDKDVADLSERIINLAYTTGNQSAIDDLESALKEIKNRGDTVGDYPQINQSAVSIDPNELDFDIDASIGTLTGINTSAMEALAGATTNTLLERHVPIVRATEDIYKEILANVAGLPLTGVETRIEATQRALNQFADRGIKTFTTRPDRNGRRRTYDMATYSEMVMRTQIGQASLQGHMDKLQSIGFELIQVSDHAEECPLCRPWEGKILTISGNSPDHPSLAEATAQGLFHTYCGHRANSYFEGITKPLGKTADPDGYEQRETQRALERRIRKWKKRKAVAITDIEKKQANKKLAYWEQQMDEFTTRTGRRRKTEREGITRAR